MATPVSPEQVSPLSKKRRRWIRRHPVATIILAIIFGMLFVAAFSSDDIGAAVSAVIFLLVLVVAVIWVGDRLLGWLRERDMRHLRRVVSSVSPAIKFPTMPAVPAATSPAAIESAPEIPPPAARMLSLGDILTFTPSEFEEFCVQLLTRVGFTDVLHRGGAGDLGADIAATDPQGKSVVAQCKRYVPGNQVGSPVLQSFIGMSYVHHHADRAVFIATSSFSQPAIELAQDHRIVLLDGDDVVKLANLVGMTGTPQVQRGASDVRGVMANRKYCPNCGTNLPLRERRCPACGHSLPIE